MMKQCILTLAAALLVSCTLLSAPVQAADTIVKIETSMGDILVRLDERRAPVTVNNFLQYARAGFYENTIFHRVIKGFMIQGGGMSVEMRPKDTRAPIKNEVTPETRNARYTIAMARTSEPNSATSQFFINTKNNRFLDPDKSQDGVGYCVFGRVIQGQQVVDKIEHVETRRKGPYDDVPVNPVVIRRVVIMSDRNS